MSNFTLPTIGSSFTTQKSGVTGIVMNVVPNPSGTARVLLELPNGTERWTTVKP
jgi:hypothetical protein